MTSRLFPIITTIAIALACTAAVDASSGGNFAPFWMDHGNTPASGMMDRRGAGMMQIQTGTARGEVTMSEAIQHVRAYTQQYGDSNLALDEVLEFQRNYYAVVKDRATGKGAFEVLVDKSTGVVFPEYGPAMMWNTMYRMMSGWMGGRMGYGRTTGPVTVSPARARRIAQHWLNLHRPGSRTEAPDRFPGYYTLHFRKEGRIAGMFSVNGYSGSVWFHNWHGKFIRMRSFSR